LPNASEMGPRAFAGRLDNPVDDLPVEDWLAAEVLADVLGLLFSFTNGASCASVALPAKFTKVAEDAIPACCAFIAAASRRIAVQYRNKLLANCI